ncbi:MAG: IS110 family transposase [Actinomycetota bacterium]|nr:IS110 family transposase [Actinomycetota bacterium]
MGNNVEEIETDEHEERLERVGAIDVAKASGKVCVRLPHRSVPGRRVTKVWDVPATTNAIAGLADELFEMGIERVVLESTSDYWRAFFYLLEARGICVWLVNAREVRNVPGRPKTDKLDSIWLCKLNERGMLRPSFVPPSEIRELRDYTRLRTDLVRERSRHKQRVEKLLEDALVKISTVASDVFGVSGRAMLAALIAGERDPEVLAELAKRRMRKKIPELREALTCRFDEHHAELLGLLLRQVDSLSAEIDLLTCRIEELIAQIPAAQAPADPETGEIGGSDAASLGVIERLDEVTGIGRPAAQAIVAEIGLNMAQFPTPGHLVSWAKVTPRTIQSGSRTRGAKTGKGNPYLKAVLGEAAAAAIGTDTFLGVRYRRLVKRTGKLKALVAIERSILVIVWHLLSDPSARYVDLGADFYERRIDTSRKTRDLIRQLQALGHQVTLSPAA